MVTERAALSGVEMESIPIAIREGEVASFA